MSNNKNLLNGSKQALLENAENILDTFCDDDILQIKIINKSNEQFKIYKKKYGATKTFVADKLGVSRQHIYNILTSDSITLENAIKLAIIFECDLEDIVSYEIL